MPHAKPILVFVPGLGATGEVYEPFLKQWRDSYDVRIAMHPLDFPKRLDWTFFFRTIDQVVRGADRIVLIGHSMGGTIALAYAARHPHRIDKIIAVAPPVVIKRKFVPKGLVRFRGFRRLQNLWLGLLGGSPVHALRTVRIRAAVLAGGRRRRLYDWTNSVDLSQELDTLRHATVLWARHEEVITQDHLIELRKHPNIHLVEVPGSHNYLPLRPGPLQPYVREVLDG